MSEKRPQPVGHRPTTADDYDVFCGEQIDSAGRYFGVLRIRRKFDGRIIYPFEGCSRAGPCATGPDARRVALAMADELIRADIATPEP